MSTLHLESEPRARKLSFSESDLILELKDGRVISVPFNWFSRLDGVSIEQLEDFEFLGAGDGIHWLQLNEDLSVKGLLLGTH